MSLTSSLFSGISGLTTLGNSMQIIGDNIANVNTVGFKSSSYAFQDLLAQATATQSGTSQIGRGTALGDIYSTFEQGSFESTGNTTDLAIGGDGFFQLREGASERLFYTRAGNFRYNKDGYLVNPEGYVVQGWALDSDTGEDVGSIGDIQLASFTSAPSETEHVTQIINLDSDATSQTASLVNAWDATNSTPIASTNYEYQSTVKIYDSLGSTHDITTYFDKISGSDWEYIVTCNPAEDQRANFNGTSSAGLLARGNINFSQSSGTILPNGLSMYTLDGQGHSLSVSGQSSAGWGGTGPGTTSTSAINTNAFTLNSTAITLTWNGTQWNVTSNGGYTDLNVVTGSTGTALNVSLDASGNTPATDIAFTFTNAPAGAGATYTFTTGGITNWTAASTNTNGYFEFTPDFIGGTGTAMAVEFDLGVQDDGTGTFVADSMTTTQFSRSSTTTFQASDGYGAGDLQGVDVDVDGVITGIYSNGQLVPLNRVALAKFTNVQELHKEGGNLYRETRESGDAITGHPGENGLGDVSPNSLEQSNVDIANEFVKMITSQRGFQANSKIITTVDSMLSETINMKR